MLSVLNPQEFFFLFCSLFQPARKEKNRSGVKARTEMAEPEEKPEDICPDEKKQTSDEKCSDGNVGALKRDDEKTTLPKRSDGCAPLPDPPMPKGRRLIRRAVRRYPLYERIMAFVMCIMVMVFIATHLVSANTIRRNLMERLEEGYTEHDSKVANLRKLLVGKTMMCAAAWFCMWIIVGGITMFNFVNVGIRRFWTYEWVTFAAWVFISAVFVGGLFSYNSFLFNVVAISIWSES